MRRLLREQFVVTMKSGDTWSGVLVEADEHTLSMLHVQKVQPDGTSVSADGQMFLPRSDVAYMQRA